MPKDTKNNLFLYFLLGKHKKQTNRNQTQTQQQQMMACPTEMTVLESTEKVAIIMRTCVIVKCESLKGTQNDEDWPETAENMPIYFHL